ncbi:MAG: type II toxin-antitoxin system VapC family toxin [Candidatus Limnocylindrales bacterium]
MTLYAESSAVLAWLLDEVEGGKVEQALSSSDLVVASELTLVECDRTLLRAVALGEMTQEAVQDLQADLMSVAAGWNIQTIESRIVERARQSFPDDRIRSLDAIHLASALVARSALGDIDLLSLDERIRATGIRLGFRVLPE